MEFRCPSKLHMIRRGDLIEIKCNSSRCGHAAGAVCLHYFTLDGKHVDTKVYKDPGRIRE